MLEAKMWKEAKLYILCLLNDFPEGMWKLVLCRAIALPLIVVIIVDMTFNNSMRILIVFIL